MSEFKDFLEEQLKDPEVKAAYDAEGGRMSDKYKVRICFEAKLMDEDGSPYNIGLEMTIGDAGKELSSKEYAELTSGINFLEVLKSFCLEGIVDPTDIWVITPEEYDEKYEKGDEE